MEKAKEKMKNLTRKLANIMIDDDVDGWPPECTIFAYQPVRPRREEQDTIGLEESDAKYKK